MSPKETGMTNTHLTTDLKTARSESREICEVDEVNYSDHLSCSVCTILIGPGHLEPVAVTENLCSNCSLPSADRVLGWVPGSASEAYGVAA